MSVGKEMRMARLFNPKSKRMVLVTMDHGICINPMKEINESAKVVHKTVEERKISRSLNFRQRQDKYVNYLCIKHSQK